jgi:hypothetical protein
MDLVSLLGQSWPVDTGQEPDSCWIVKIQYDFQDWDESTKIGAFFAYFDFAFFSKRQSLPVDQTLPLLSRTIRGDLLPFPGFWKTARLPQH